MTKIFFNPHVGKFYGTTESLFSKKILVLGNSHYCGECPECGDRSISDGKCLLFTINTIATYLNPNHSGSWKATYTTFVNSLVGKTSTMEDRKAVFDSILFYNYLQVSAGADAYSSGKYDFKEKRHLDAFYEVLDAHLPDVVICWGARVWNVLPDDWGYGSARRGRALDLNGGEFLRYQVYPYRDREALLIGVKHPCVGYSVQFHHDVFSKLIFNPTLSNES